MTIRLIYKYIARKLLRGLAMETEISGRNRMSEDSKSTKKPGPDTDDIPAGDMPKPPAWHLPLAALAYAAWLIFLIIMLSFRPAGPY